MLHIVTGILPVEKRYNRYRFRRSELATTDTLLNAIAAPAIAGLSMMPMKGYNAPAAIGIPTIL